MSAKAELTAAIKRLQDAVDAKNNAAIEALSAEVKTLKTQLDAAAGTKAIPFPANEDGAEAGKKALGKMLVMPTANADVKRLQELNDQIYIASRLMNEGKGVDPRSLTLYREFTDLAKALDTTDTSNWIPTGLSNELIGMVKVLGNVRQLHPEFNMPTNPYIHPTVTAGITAYAAGESTSDTADKFTASDSTDGVITHTAKKIAARTLVSAEMDEDAAVAATAEIKALMAAAQAEGVETAIINGDNSGDHMDADVTAAADVRKLFNGYRNCVATAAKQDLATFTSDTIFAIRGKMGRYGVNPKNLAIVTSFAGYIKLMTLKDAAGNAIFLTGDKYTPAVNVAGELGQLGGSPVIVSEFVREDLNAAGIYDGTTKTKSELLFVYRPGFRIGNKRQVTIKSNPDLYMESDQTVVVSTQRLAVTPMYDPTTNYIVGLGYNF